MLHEETIQTGFEDSFCLCFQETRKYTTALILSEHLAGNHDS